jgi:uncharacterized protein YndB with AHSA1/START domain
MAGMASVNVLVRRSPQQVWEVLSDGHAYASWVLGTREIRAVDEEWPQVGAAIHYTVGWGPLALRGRTTVRAAEPGRMLGLEADAGLLGTARIVIELTPWGEDTVVLLDEHPLTGTGSWLHNPVTDVVSLLRQEPMMRSLARLVEQRYPR